MEAVFLASDSDTEDGSFRSMEAVRKASCFCCIDVPWLEAVEEGGGAPGAESLPKRDERPLREGDWTVVGEAVVEGWSLHGFAG